MKSKQPTELYLHLEDGQVITGQAFGYPTEMAGEVVFSTGMTGYTESLTDPSFAGQILTFTYPLIGNYGVPQPQPLAEAVMANFESAKIWARGVIVTNVSREPSHHASHQSFHQWLYQHKIPGLSLVDTRALTQKIREQGVMPGFISRHRSLKKNPVTNGVFSVDLTNYVAEASHKKVVKYDPTQLGYTFNGKTLVLIDCGVKHGIIRQLLLVGYKVIRVPWDFDPLSLPEKFDGVFVSNGPGDPKDCGVTVNNIRNVLATGIPYVGVCLGHQLLALAIGADTYKLSYGHRGLNQPCQDVLTKKAYLTSQNHGYTVRKETIPKDFQEWFVNLNDGTNEGLINEKKKIWSVQFHPEGCPGPFDTAWIFELLK